MKRTRRWMHGGVALLAMCALLAAGSSCGGGDGGEEPVPLIYVPAALFFGQVSYAQDDAWEQVNSGFGECVLEFEADPGVLYFNLVIQNPMVPTEDVWVLDNFPAMSFGTEAGATTQTLSIPFDLLVPPGMPVTDLFYSAALTNLPLSTPPATFSAAFVLAVQDQFWTGDAGGPTAPAPAPQPKPSTKTLKIVRTGFATRSKFPNQEVGKGECVPGAVSNSVKYLNSTNNLGLSEAQTSVDAMKPKTSWDAGPPPGSSTGATDAWWDKKSEELAKPPYNMDTDIDQQDGTQADRVSDFDQMVTDVGAGKNVEVRIAGHAANVTGAAKVEVDGKTYYLLYVSHDTSQDKPGGTKTEPVLYDPETNTYTGGWLFDGAQHDRFVTESPKPS